MSREATTENQGFKFRRSGGGNQEVAIQCQGNPLVCFSFTVSIAMAAGAGWEIFEFSMDQLFGLKERYKENAKT